MTIAIPLHGSVEKGHGDDGAFGCGTEIVLAERKPPWRPNEDEIVRAAITVILVALGVIIALAAGAILTMG